MNDMPLSRRRFLIAGLGTSALALTGCGGAMSVDPLPSAPWPDAVARPDRRGRNDQPPADRAYTDRMLGQVIPRSRWAKGDPILRRINAMGRIANITVHHEGAAGAPVYFSDLASTAARLELIRNAHLQRMTAGDIGYHYVIDRAGRLWEGRDVRYQGAHVKDHNRQNVGVMVLGNFDIQSPTDAQLDSLRRTVLALRRRYRVTERAIYTHQELAPTACPGRALQAKVEQMRSRDAFA